MLALLLIFGKKIEGFGIGAVAVIGITRADTIDFDGSVDGKCGIEESREGTEGEGCEGGDAEMRRGTVTGCEGVSAIEEA